MKQQYCKVCKFAVEPFPTVLHTGSPIYLTQCCCYFIGSLMSVFCFPITEALISFIEQRENYWPAFQICMCLGSHQYFLLLSAYFPANCFVAMCNMKHNTHSYYMMHASLCLHPANVHIVLIIYGGYVLIGINFGCCFIVHN